MNLPCEFDPAHWASAHVVTQRPDGRGLRITAHVCADHLDPWVAQLHQQDGHAFISQRPTDGTCRPYGLCK